MPRIRKTVRNRTEPTPCPLETFSVLWDRLGALAEEMRQLAPWSSIPPEQLFGVQEPRTGLHLWVHLVGGELPRVCVLVGDRSLEVHSRRHTGRHLHEDELHDTDQLILLYQTDPSVPMPGRVPPRGPGSRNPNAAVHAVLMHQRPGCPLGPALDDDPALMALVLEQLKELHERLKADPTLLDPHVHGGLLVRTIDPATAGDAPRWIDTRVTRLHRKPPAVQPVDADQMEYLRQYCTPIPATLDCDVVFVPFPSRERGCLYEHYTAAFVMLDSEDGMVIHFSLLACPERWSAAQADLQDWIENMQRIPQALRVRRAELHAQLEPLTSALGIPLSLEPDLPGCDVLANDLALHFQTLGPRHPLRNMVPGQQRNAPRKKGGRSMKTG